MFSCSQSKASEYIVLMGPSAYVIILCHQRLRAAWERVLNRLTIGNEVFLLSDTDDRAVHYRIFQW